ncbi:thioesterase family protein [Angustibacter luteus]|uniref:Thioesterase family protein n=1 Tax=Angustibacter luteus TaxID=658456 RepID=A0ABW1JB03_9ACTN
MAESFFTRTGGDRYAATPATVGPWSAQHMHGGPPSALLVHRSEQAARDAQATGSWRAARTVVDFLGPVPVGDVEVRAAVVRGGRTAVLVDAELSAGGRPTLRSRTWLVRLPDGAPTPTTVSTPPTTSPESAPPFTQWGFPYAEHLDWHLASGELAGPGAAATWARPRVPLVDDEPLTGLQRACLVADSGNGISAELSWDDWAFVNIDLTVHLLREPVDDWLLLSARSQLDPAGAGLATSTLHDRAGLVGNGAQTLVVQPR